MNRNNRHLAECRHKMVDDEAMVVLFSCTGSKFDVSYMARRPSAWGHRGNIGMIASGKEDDK